ncbi:hypothetical protein CIK05_12135 [Bdellovibrio sp. qaytius]|nr:hypothetical protein CIK05_12135 [Bdellovibrio sp. qaytius]
MTVSKQFALLILIAVGISSCSPKSGGPAPASLSASEVSRDFSNTSFAVAGSDLPSDFANCTFNGQTVLHNASVSAYQNSSVPYGSSCVSQLRRCNNGVLSGSYQYGSCSAAGPASCLFNGQTIAHGAVVQAFQNSSVAYGSTCSSEQRTCNNGVLSGSNAFASCNVAGPASCLFNGQTVAHGSNVNAFANSTVAFGQTCAVEQRSCNNGVLSGSNAYASCNVDAAASCLFNGQTVAHGSNVPAFANSTVAYGDTCVAEQRSCNNGVLSGSNSYASCNVDAPASCLFNGQTVAHGSKVPAFPNSTVAYGSSCVAESRTCDNGVLSGSSPYATCAVDAAASCLFNGQTLAHGQSAPAFQNSSVAYGSSCVSEQRTCDNGSMSGSFQYGSCNVDSAKSCLFNGQTVAHGQSVQAFPSSSVGFGSMCISDTRTCDNGILSGSNQYASCAVDAAASCLFNGQTIAHNQSIQAFVTSTVGFGEKCSGEERICYNGVLDGSNQYASCTVAQPASCLINGLTIAHGQTTILFKSSSVAYGQSCESESRTCANGTLSGSFSSGSCVVEEAKTCSFNGQTIANGDAVQAYATSSVAFGQSCQSETRSCSNGVLSGTNTNSSCSVEAAKSCSFNGQTIANGASVQAFSTSSVAFGQTCKSETRSCSNGVLSGTNTNSSCSVEAAKSCTFNGQTIANGATVEAWSTNSVAYGQSCKSEVRSCSNGVLSGSNTYGSCSVEAPKSCSFNGSTVANGSSVKAYSSAQVPYGQTCQSENRTCTNGVLSGSNTVASCTVAPKPPVVVVPPTPPKSCTFNGKTVASGASVQAFKASSVGYGQSCQSETRTCTNGVLSGSNTAASCEVEGPKSCKILFGLITIPHGFTLFAATHSSAGAGSRCEAEVTLCNNGQFVIDPSITCQHGDKPPVTVPPPKPGEVQCELDPKSNNGKHIGVDHEGKHGDSGLHLGWYKDEKPCKQDPKPPVTPVPPKQDPPCKHEHDPKKPCAHEKDPKKPCDHKPCEHNDKHKTQKEKDDCDKKQKK